MQYSAVQARLGIAGIGLDRLAVQCSRTLDITLIGQKIGQIA